jgi:uncharacterized protein (TIGR00255 family)
MIQSMTGYGKASREINGCLVTVEIKSVNSKSFEMGLRLPTGYKEKEQDIRILLARELERGKIEVTVSTDNGNEIKRGILNKTVIKAYLDDFRALGKEFKLPEEDYLRLIIGLPNVMSTEKTEIDEGEWKQIEQLIKKAVKEFYSFRLNEGKVLEKDLLLRVKNIFVLLKQIEKHEPNRMTIIKNRLSKMLSGQEESLIDKNRFEQELIYYLEKIDITEEKVRLKSHCDYFLQTAKEKQSNGKKLSFIIQEIGREINTIGSKANDAAIQHHVVEMKDELEKMKEQVANIL